MEQRMKKTYSITEVNLYIKNIIACDYALNHIYVKGEVSNCKYHTSNHIYFTLKDKKSQIACVMFAGQRSGLSFPMREGQSVVVFGSIAVYERDGKYQLYANEIQLEGTGLLYERYERLKTELEEEGLFAMQYKKPIPAFANRIGIVTAETGAVIHDIINVSSRRNPYVQLYLYPAKVQGDGAAESIVAGIRFFERQKVDLIIIGRGGGSIEDLWAFNEEIVARAIFECSIPLISAVGHETDFTIADYVSDLRAPTPSAAAELGVFDIRSVLYTLENIKIKLEQMIQKKIEQKRNKLETFTLKLQHQSPENQLLQKKQYLLDLEQKIERMMEEKLNQQKHKMILLTEQMKGVSPLNKLSQGYAYVTNEQGNMVKTVKQVESNQTLKLSLIDGDITVKIEEVITRRRIGKWQE